jgi:transposase
MDKDQLARMLDDGWSFERIGRQMGLDGSTVGRWARKYGLESTQRQRHLRRASLSRELLAELVAEDLTVREIASTVERSATTVRYWLRRYGLETTERARFARRRTKATLFAHCSKHGHTEFIQRRDGSSSCGRCRADSVSAWRRRAKRILVAEAGGKCALCGYDRCVAAMHFHHVDPSTKRFSLSSRGLARAIEILREEAAKCVLLCGNCHAEVEAGFTTL